MLLLAYLLYANRGVFDHLSDNTRKWLIVSGAFFFGAWLLLWIAEDLKRRDWLGWACLVLVALEQYVVAHEQHLVAHEQHEQHELAQHVVVVASMSRGAQSSFGRSWLLPLKRT